MASTMAVDAAALSGPNVPRAVCAGCGKGTPIGFAFCQHCGQRMQLAVPASRPMPAVISTPAPAMIAETMAAPQPQAVVPPRPQPSPPPTGVAPAPAPISVQSQPFGRLVALDRKGADGQVVPIEGETFDVGRTEGGLRFAQDPYVAPRHLRLSCKDGKVVARALDEVNGVYLRIDAPWELEPGDQLILGKELLRYEALAPEERDPPSLVDRGVRVFGSVPRTYWGRLRQLTIAGTTGDLWLLCRAELVLGREEGDVTFPEDEFMSRRHATIRRQGTKARLEDLGSSNGTFVRLQKGHELRPGNILRVGDQLLRFDA